MSDWNLFGWNPFSVEWTRHQYVLIDWLSMTSWLRLLTLTLDWTILFLKDIYIRGGLEYLHRSPASRKRRVLRDDLKGIQCEWEWLRVLRDSDHWVIILQIADPSSRQRGRPTETRQKISDSNIPTGSNIWSQVPQGCSIPRHADWPTDRQS
jgi:hypothetical protein